MVEYLPNEERDAILDRLVSMPENKVKRFHYNF